jgi:hypothetical protein
MYLEDVVAEVHITNQQEELEVKDTREVLVVVQQFTLLVVVVVLQRLEETLQVLAEMEELDFLIWDGFMVVAAAV